MDKYEKLEKVGEGSYGKVYKAIEKSTGRLVAIKKSRLEMDVTGIPRSMIREISILKLLSESIYVVRLLDVEYVRTESVPPKSSIYLVFEYLDTDLRKFIKSYRKGPNPRRLEPFLIQRLMFQLCKGVELCHTHAVLHRDLKPANLLLVKDIQLLKIADLGLARTFTVPITRAYTHAIVTLWYRAPEVLLGCTHYSTGVDMWSVGCIFAEMVRMDPLFGGDSELGQLIEIFSLLGTPTEQQWPGVSSLRNWSDNPKWEPQDITLAVPTLSPQGIDLLTKMLTYNPAERISAKRALDHPYFDSLDKSQF